MAFAEAHVYVATNLQQHRRMLHPHILQLLLELLPKIQALNEGKVSSEDFVINCETVC